MFKHLHKTFSKKMQDFRVFYQFCICMQDSKIDKWVCPHIVINFLYISYLDRPICKTQKDIKS